MSWIKKHYRIGLHIRAQHQNGDYEAAKIVNHVQGNGFRARHIEAIRVRFEDGTYTDISAAFLEEDGSDLVDGMPGQ